MEIESVWFWSWLGIGTSLNRIWDKIQIGGKSGPWFGRKRMGRFRWFRILPWSSGLSYFTRKRQTATSTNHWTTSRFVFSIHKFLGGISDFRKPLVFCSSNIDFYSLICKYYCSIFHSHTALCIEKTQWDEEEFFKEILEENWYFFKENLGSFGI